MQITNFSKRWELQVCWVDGDGSVVPRLTLKPGTRHVEVTSSKHLWILIAAPVKSSHRHDEDEGGNSSSSSTKPEIINTTSVCLLMRPSLASLAPRKCTSLLWTPWQAISVTQRIRPKLPPKHKLSATQIESSGGVINILPHLIIQVLDGVK